MIPKTVVVGSPRRILKQWLQDVADFRRKEPFAPVWVVVPGHPAAAALTRALTRSVNVRILPLWDFARNLIPAGSLTVPKGLETILAKLLPLSIVQDTAFSRAPGFSQPLLRTALWVRREPEAARRLGRLDPFWHELLRWVEAALPPALLDEGRVYQYAAASVFDTLPKGKSLFCVWGFDRLHQGQRNMVQTAGESARLCVYIPGPVSDGDGPEVGWWRRRGARVVRLPASEPPGRVIRVAASPARQVSSGFRAIGRLLHSRPLSDLVLLTPGWQGNQEVERLGFQLGLAAGEHMRIPRRNRERWRSFLDVCQGVAGRAETLWWLNRRGVFLNPEVRRGLYRHGGHWRARLWEQTAARPWLTWAEDFGGRVSRAKTLDELGQLVEEARSRQPELDVAPLITHLKIWGSHANLGPLSPAEAWEWIQRLPDQPEEPTAGSGLIWDTLPAAPPLPAGGMVITGVHDGPVPDEDAIPPQLLSPELIERIGLTVPSTARRYQDALALAPFAALEVVLVGEEDSDGTMRWPAAAPRGECIAEDDLPALPAPAHPIPAGVADWYRAHRREMTYNRYTGDLMQPLDLDSIAASPSGLEQFGTCPYAFFLQRVAGLQPPERSTGVLGVDGAEWGRWAHRVLERFTADAATMTAEAVTGEIGRLVETVVAEEPPGEEVLPVLLVNAKKQLKAQLAEAVWRHRAMWRGRETVVREWSFEWRPAGLGIKGRIDRVDRLDDGAMEIVDYKSGGMKDPARIGPDNLQLPLYCEAFADLRQVPRGRVAGRLLGISQKNGFQSRCLDASGNRTVRPLVEAAASRIAQGRFYPLPHANGNPCRICDFRPVCPHDVAEESRIKRSRATEYRALWEEAEADEPDGAE